MDFVDMSLVLLFTLSFEPYLVVLAFWNLSPSGILECCNFDLLIIH